MHYFWKGFFHTAIVIVVALVVTHLSTWVLGLSLEPVAPSPKMLVPRPEMVYPYYEEEALTHATTSALLRSQVKAKIETSFQTKKYENLDGILYATILLMVDEGDCCGFMGSKSALEKLALVLSDKKFVFQETGDQILYLKSTFPEKYSGSIVGISTDKTPIIVSFQLDPDNFIRAIWVDTKGTDLDR